MTEIFLNKQQVEKAPKYDSDKALFGFWVYLMTDLIMFAAMFATYIVLRGNTFAGPGPRELFSLPGALVETLVLLTSSFVCGLAMLSAKAGNKKATLMWFGLTFILGAAFLVLEVREFSQLLAEGFSWQSNAFLSAFYSLLGMHGLHIAVGLLWLVVAMVHIKILGLSEFVISKLARLSLFWHFLDIVWIFIFTIVYLHGHL